MVYRCGEPSHTYDYVYNIYLYFFIKDKIDMLLIFGLFNVMEFLDLINYDRSIYLNKSKLN